MKALWSALLFPFAMAAGLCSAAGPEPTTLDQPGAARAVAFSPDGKLLAVGVAIPSETPSGGNYPRGEVILWDVAAGEPRRRLAGHAGEVNCLAFSPDGKVLASGGHRQYTLHDYGTEQNLKLWEAETGRELRTILGQGGAINGLAFSPDGTTLASGGWDGTVKLRLADRDWVVRATLKPPTEKTRKQGVWDLAFHPSGAWLAVGVTGGEVEIWDVKTLRMKAKLRVHRVSNGGSGVEITPDGKTLVTVGPKGTIQLWDAESLELRRSLRVAEAWELCLSPNGKVTAMGAFKKWDQPASVVLWDASFGKQIATLEGHQKAVSCLAFSPDGRLLASASYDGTVKLWPIGEVVAGDDGDD